MPPGSPSFRVWQGCERGPARGVRSQAERSAGAGAAVAAGGVGALAAASGWMGTRRKGLAVAGGGGTAGLFGCCGGKGHGTVSAPGDAKSLGRGRRVGRGERGVLGRCGERGDARGWLRWTGASGAGSGGPPAAAGAGDARAGAAPATPSAAADRAGRWRAGLAAPPDVTGRGGYRLRAALLEAALAPLCALTPRCRSPQRPRRPGAPSLPPPAQVRGSGEGTGTAGRVPARLRQPAPVGVRRSGSRAARSFPPSLPAATSWGAE